jgi:hypothetical protein
MATRFRQLPVDQHPTELGMWYTNRFDQVLKGLVVFKVQAERGVFSIMWQEIVQFCEESEVCFS